MKKGFWVLSLTVFILGLSIWELVFINKTIDIMTTKCNSLYESVIKEVKSEELVKQIDQVKKYWKIRESKLCLIVSHKDMTNIADNLAFLLAAAKNDDSDAEKTYAILLKDNMSYLSHLISFNFENIL